MAMEDLGRILMNMVALKFGYSPLKLYSRDGDSRSEYITALREADNGVFSSLRNLINKELRIL